MSEKEELYYVDIGALDKEIYEKCRASDEFIAAGRGDIADVNKIQAFALMTLKRCLVKVPVNPLDINKP